MNENNSVEAIDNTNLIEESKFRIIKIVGIENCFHEENNQRKTCSKKLNKYATVFDYIDKVLNCFKCNKWSRINYFIYEYYWITSWKVQVQVLL